MKKIFTLILAALVSAMLFAGTETTVYYTASTSVIGTYTVKLNVNFKGDGDDWHQYTMTKTDRTYNDDPVYSYTYTDAYDGVGVMQFQLYDGDTWKSQKQPISNWTGVGTYNGKMFVHSTETWVAPPAADPTAKYYITGDSALVVDAGAGIGKKWDPQAIKATSDSYVLTNLKAGIEYKLKLTADGTWNTALGFSALTAVADGLAGDHDGNICFTLTAAGNVTVTYTNTTFTVTGSFKPVAKRTIKLVPSEEWLVADAKFAAWIWGTDIMSQWTAFFAPVSSGNDTLQALIPANADSIEFVRFSPKVKTPEWVFSNGEEVIIWGQMKTKLYADSTTWTVVGWDAGKWTPFDKPCESYGLSVNGNFVAGKKNVLYQGQGSEYMLRGVELTAGQKVKLCDACNSYATWVEENFSSTSFTFPIEDGAYKVEESGKYDFYIKFIDFGYNEVYVSKEGTYTTAVRDQCEGVMMQAFFYDSYRDGANGTELVGNTRWETLLPQADSIGKYFDYVWLPPSAYGSGTGYHPKNYSDQNSCWGTRESLEALISALHNAGAKVIADIVINHCEGWSSWCDFPTLDFGQYGVFHPDASYICKNDEVNADWNKASAGACSGAATGNYDDGENWDGARDWAHDNVYVQDMFKAYLKWMRNVMKYDGFRYDKGDGFNNWHHDNYNRASTPEIAFMECYSGDDKIIWGIEQANRNLMALDFQTRWDAICGISGFNYSKCKGSGLLGKGYAKYAVTFIDSHDWFMRDDNGNEFGGHGNSLTDELKDRLLQANAYILGMPGVPCIFYPHWYKYSTELKDMINARKLAGVHSESSVYDEEAEDGGYKCTLQGKYGWLRLQLGNKTSHENCGDANYKLIAKGPGYAMWVYRTAPIPTAIDEVGNEDPVIKAEKFMKNGRLFIRLGDKVYNVLGNTIK